MDIQVEKAILIERLQKINDLSLIQAVKHMIDYGLGEKESSISIEQYNKVLDEAEAEMDRGEYISHEELTKQMESIDFGDSLSLIEKEEIKLALDQLSQGKKISYSEYRSKVS